MWNRSMLIARSTIVWIKIVWIKLSRSKFSGSKLSGSNCLDQIVWIKLSGSNCLDQIVWIKIFSGWNFLDKIFWIKIVCIKLHESNYLGTLNWNIQIILQGITPVKCEIVPCWSLDPQSSESNCLDQIV